MVFLSFCNHVVEQHFECNCRPEHQLLICKSLQFNMAGLLKCFPAIDHQINLRNFKMHFCCVKTLEIVIIYFESDYIYFKTQSVSLSNICQMISMQDLKHAIHGDCANACKKKLQYFSRDTYYFLQQTTSSTVISVT